MGRCSWWTITCLTRASDPGGQPGEIRHRRRHTGRGRKKHADLKPPDDLWVGVVKKIRSPTGSLLDVQTRALFGRKKRFANGSLTWASVLRDQHIAPGAAERNDAWPTSPLASSHSGACRVLKSICNGACGCKCDFYNWIHPHGSLQSRAHRRWLKA